LHGIETGIQFVNDSSVDVVGVIESDDPNFVYMLVTIDHNQKVPINKYFDINHFIRSEPFIKVQDIGSSTHTAIEVDTHE